MEEFQTRVIFRIGETAQVTLKLRYSENEREGHVEIEVLRDDDRVGRLGLRVNPDSHGLFFDPGSMNTDEARCITSCLGVAAGRGLVECLLGSRSLSEIRACVRRKAAGTLVDAALCVAQCMGLA